MRLTDDQIKMARITYTKVVQDDFILDLIDTIEALQQENEQLQEFAKAKAEGRLLREAAEKALSTCNVTKLQCAECNPCCEHRAKS